MRDIDRVVEANKAAGGTFFDKRTILYFKSKVLPTMYGGKYFVSYDLTENGKRFTIRKVLGNGLIAVEGERHTYDSKEQAVTVIHALLSEAVSA